MVGKLLLAVGLLGQGTPGAVVDVLSGDAAAYHGESSRRHLEAQSANERGQAALTLSPLQHRPASLFIEDLTSDPNHSFNRAFADYYRLESVTVGDDGR